MRKLATITLASLTALTIGIGAAQAEGDPEKGKRVFNKCKACHMVGEKAKKRIGPPLNDIIGAQAGSQEDYKYSANIVQLGKDGLKWTEDQLDAYLKKPKDIVPKGKMVFPGLKKESDRLNVIAYLKQFSKKPE